MDIKYREVRNEDGYEWYTLLDSVWRVVYAHIFPVEVFNARDEHREERAAGFTKEKFIGERKTAYVAEHDGKIVGVMFGTLDSDYEYLPSSKALYNRKDKISLHIGIAFILFGQHSNYIYIFATK